MKFDVVHELLVKFVCMAAGNWHLVLWLDLCRADFGACGIC